MFGAPIDTTQATQPFFMGGATQGQATQGDAKKPRQEEKSTVLPTTIRAIEKAIEKKTDVDVTFYGTEPGMLLLVAVVESVEQDGLHLEMMLNDSTGRIKAKHFATDNDNMLQGIEVGKYLQVSGQLRTSPAAHISVTNARAVRSADDISFHMIESAHAALRLQTPARAAKAQLMEVTLPTNPTAPTPAPVSFSTPAPAAAAPASAGASTGDAKASVKALLEKNAAVESGLSVKDICAQLGSSEAAVKSALDQLMEDGDVFNTIDDDHFGVLS